MMGGERYVDPVFDRPLPSSEQAPIPQARATTTRQRSTGDRRSLLDGGLKDFRGVVSETDEAGEMPTYTPQELKDIYAAQDRELVRGSPDPRDPTYMLNRGDRGLLDSLENISAPAA